MPKKRLVFFILILISTPTLISFPKSDKAPPEVVDLIILEAEMSG
jgi:hypothetical protein